MICHIYEFWYNLFLLLISDNAILAGTGDAVKFIKPILLFAARLANCTGFLIF
jgi:hypothetical protein